MRRRAALAALRSAAMRSGGAPALVDLSAHDGRVGVMRRFRARVTGGALLSMIVVSLGKEPAPFRAGVVDAVRQVHERSPTHAVNGAVSKGVEVNPTVTQPADHPPLVMRFERQGRAGCVGVVQPNSMQCTAIDDGQTSLGALASYSPSTNEITQKLLAAYEVIRIAGWPLQVVHAAARRCALDRKHGAGFTVTATASHRGARRWPATPASDQRRICSGSLLAKPLGGT